MDEHFEKIQKPLPLTGRALLGLYFIIPGISKVTGFAGMSEYTAAHGVPFNPVLRFH